MMNSGFDDEFAPNPFRSGGGGNDFLSASNPQPQQQQMMYGQPQQQQQQQQMMYGQNPVIQQQQQFQQQQYYPSQQQQYMQQQPPQQPDPNSGMIGNYQMPPPPVQIPPPNPAQYLSGTMDHGAASMPQQPGNYGATRDIPSTPFSIFSWRGLLSCIRLDTYQQYFDVDTVDITDRLKASMFKFYQPDLFRTEVIGDNTIIIQPANAIDPNAPRDPTFVPPPVSPTATDGTNKKGPDLYGPLWISMTLIFVLGMTSNLSAYFHHQKYAKHQQKAASAAGDDGAAANITVDEFEYDITHLIRAGSIVMIFCFFVPTTFWLLTNCLGMPGISWSMWMCCYGYSAVPILIGALMAWWFPYALYHWIVLAMATSASGMLVVRNLSTPLLSQDTSTHARAAPIILAILGTHFVYLCILKFSFFTHEY